MTLLGPARPVLNETRRTGAMWAADFKKGTGFLSGTNVAGPPQGRQTEPDAGDRYRGLTKLRALHGWISCHERRLRK